MAVAEVKVSEIGSWVSPDSPVNITPERTRHWVQGIKDRRALGYSIPLAWGHVLDSKPLNPSERTYLSARYNAGEILDARIDDAGQMVLKIDAPALDLKDGWLVDGQARTAIKEVSAMLANWRDGKGKDWPDSVYHVALTDHPVIPNPAGFTGLSTGSPGNTQFVRFSLQPVGVTRMATDDKAEVKKNMKEATDDEFDDIADELSDGADDKTAEEMAAEETPVASPDANLIARAKVALANAGLNLPDLGGEPDLTQFVEHLVVAVTALSGQKKADVEETKVVDKDPPHEESMPVMMSTLPPQAQKLAARFEIAQQERRTKLLERLAKRGLPPEEVERLRTVASATRLSLTADMEPAKAPIDETLELLDRVLPKVAPHLMRLSSNTVEHPNPAQGGDMVDRNGTKIPADAAREVDLMLEMSMGKKKKAV